jgi:WD40 repeat protein
MTVKLWDTQTGQELRTLRDHTGEVRGVAFSPDGRLLATCGADRMIKLYDADGGRERVSFRGDKHWVFWVAFALDGRTLFSAGGERMIKLWDLGDGEPVAEAPPVKVRT